jgi:hypothetical protein
MSTSMHRLFCAAYYASLLAVITLAAPSTLSLLLLRACFVASVTAAAPR